MGPVGKPGAQGVQGPIGPQGPAGSIQTLNITKVENTIIIPAGEPGKNGTVTSFCPFNSGLTGGAYRKDPNAVIVNSSPTANNSGWIVSDVNSFPLAVLIYQDIRRVRDTAWMCNVSTICGGRIHNNILLISRVY
ncbi:MAG: hypothetical protein AB7V56_13490 [Candidatus Nitrosocosmicus sp.]